MCFLSVEIYKMQLFNALKFDSNSKDYINIFVRFKFIPSINRKIIYEGITNIKEHDKILLNLTYLFH